MCSRLPRSRSYNASFILPVSSAQGKVVGWRRVGLLAAAWATGSLPQPQEGAESLSDALTNAPGPVVLFPEVRYKQTDETSTANDNAFSAQRQTTARCSRSRTWPRRPRARRAVSLASSYLLSSKSRQQLGNRHSLTFAPWQVPSTDPPRTLTHLPDPLILLYPPPPRTHLLAHVPPHALHLHRAPAAPLRIADELGKPWRDARADGEAEEGGWAWVGREGRVPRVSASQGAVEALASRLGIVKHAQCKFQDSERRERTVQHGRRKDRDFERRYGDYTHGPLQDCPLCCCA